MTAAGRPLTRGSRSGRSRVGRPTVFRTRAPASSRERRDGERGSTSRDAGYDTACRPAGPTVTSADSAQPTLDSSPRAGRFPRSPARRAKQIETWDSVSSTDRSRKVKFSFAVLIAVAEPEDAPSRSTHGQTGKLERRSPRVEIGRCGVTRRESDRSAVEGEKGLPFRRRLRRRRPSDGEVALPSARAGATESNGPRTVASPAASATATVSQRPHRISFSGFPSARSRSRRNGRCRRGWLRPAARAAPPRGGARRLPGEELSRDRIRATP